jgi:hypothetical protein
MSLDITGAGTIYKEHPLLQEPCTLGVQYIESIQRDALGQSEANR